MAVSKKKVPTFDQLMNPLLKALKLLGGSATVDELYVKVSEIMKLPDEILDISHGESGNLSEVVLLPTLSAKELPKLHDRLQMC